MAIVRTITDWYPCFVSSIRCVLTDWYPRFVSSTRVLADWYPCFVSSTRCVIFDWYFTSKDANWPVINWRENDVIYSPREKMI